MKKIVAFGDSFINYEWISVKGHNWVDYLGAQLNIPVMNYGISASGLGYAMDSFVKYYQSPEYSPDDIIIVVPTSEQRLYTSNMHHPRLGVVHTFAKDITSKSQSEKDWFKENGNAALWTVMNLYDPVINYELIKILSFFQLWANSHPSNSVIVVRAFGKLPGNEHAERLLNMVTPSSNFFPLLDVVTALGEIAVHEYATHDLYEQHHQYCKGIDYRINHLNAYHRMQLAKMISKVISTNSMSAVDFSWIQSNTITTAEQFNLIPKDYH